MPALVDNPCEHIYTQFNPLSGSTLHLTSKIVVFFASWALNCGLYLSSSKRQMVDVFDRFLIGNGISETLILKISSALCKAGERGGGGGKIPGAWGAQRGLGCSEAPGNRARDLIFI
jgi:hypothetical protein